VRLMKEVGWGRLRYGQIEAPRTSRLKISILCVVGVCLMSGLAISSDAVMAQQAASEQPNGTPESWANAATLNELRVINGEGQGPLRYRQRKVDAKGDTTREVIESKDGNVARLVERNGRPLTADEDAAEKNRLMEDIASPEDFLRHHRREDANRDEVMQTVRLMPKAMFYSYAPGQPQKGGNEGRQIVLDFHPDPAFRPPTMYAEMLTGLEGRVWIDARSKCITRIEAHVLRPVNFGFGIVAKIFPGGTVELEQTRAVGERWIYSHLEEHLTARVLMVKTVPENASATAWDFRPLASPLAYQDAIRVLLAMPVAVR
jgi:hypothetical protein